MTEGVTNLEPNCMYKGEKRYAYRNFFTDKYKMIGVDGDFTKEEMNLYWLYHNPEHDD